VRALPTAPSLSPRRPRPALAFAASLVLGVVLTIASCSSEGPNATADAAADADAGADASQPDGTHEADTGPGCCSPGTCAPGQRCLQGRCHTVPGEGSCLLDDDCRPGQVCDEPTVCACDDEACEPNPGRCLYPPPCCNADDECAGDGTTKVCFEGRCEATAPGTCWDDRQCPDGQVCEGVTSCPCGLSPGDPGCEGEAAPGYCALPGACCAGDAECGPGGACVAGGCVPKPSPGRCFADADCGAGEVCAGAYECACDGDGPCAVSTTPGWCLAPGEAACTRADQCGEARLCVAHEGGALCVPVPPPEGCYEDANCGAGRTCYGATWSGDGAGPGAAPTPGVCHTETRACQDDAGCGPGMRCVLPDRGWCAAPGVAPAPPAQGLCVPLTDDGCWAKGDCLPFERCTGEVICDDPAGCDAPNHAGYCTNPPLEGDCCTSHQECGPGYECRNADTTMTCPPMDTATCLPVPDYGDSCWNFMDCPTGMVCNRVFVCPCNARCWRSREGACELASEQFCNSNIDCGGEYTCARDLECLFNPCISSDDCGLGGKCHLTLPGQCWSHAECGDGNYCKGLSLCPSDTTCPDNDQPGQCAPQEEAGACCQSYFACGPGLRCLSTVTKTECELDPSSVCVPFGTFNQDCFSDADCAANRKCVGAKVCPCGVSSCTDPPQAGSCQVVE